MQHLSHFRSERYLSGMDAHRADAKLLADQQAALRRIATLVAQGAAAAELYSAVAYEAALVLGVSAVMLGRYEADRSVTIVASLNEPNFPVGSRWPLDGPSVGAAVRETGRPARIDDYARLTGAIAASVRDSSIRSTVGVPIRVDNELWGVLTVATDANESLPGDTEERLSEFAELVSTGISTATSHDDLNRVLEQQAALRRVATLVARESSRVEIFDAVTAEAARVLETEAVGMLRFEADGSAALVAQSETPWEPPPLGTRLTMEGENVVSRVLRTGKAARVDDWSNETGSVAAMASVLGVRSCVATPIAVEGRLWGVMIAATSQSEPLPADTESRTSQFTELIATAIANAESHEARARLADEQAALRRVATLVAGGAPPMEVFGAVTEEVGRLFSGDWTYVTRFDSDAAVTVLAGWMSSGEPPVQLPGRWSAGATSDAIRAAHAPVRLDPYPRRVEVEDPETAVVAAPITVEGDLWGFITIASTTEGKPPPPDTEARLSNFTELVATAISNAESRGALGMLAAEQAALRRVATLVAEESPLADVIAGVAEEVGNVLGEVEWALARDDGDGKASVLAVSDGNPTRAGARVPIDTSTAFGRAIVEGRPARIDDYFAGTGDFARIAREHGVRAAVSCPIVVRGRTWGAMSVGWRNPDPLPPETEALVGRFSYLVATAIANVEARGEVERLAEEQAALRRVATLVAEGVPPADVFAAVSREVEHVLSHLIDNTATVVRFDPGPECVLVGASRPIPETPPGKRWEPDDLYVSTRVLRTGASARVDETDLAVGGFAAEQMRRQGYLSQVASPIVVEGRLWGAMTVSAGQTLPSDTEGRLEKFTELAATAIANAESQSELAASRRRMVAAADDARRRIERDLHDGIQQQLVSLGMELGAVEAALADEEGPREQVASVSSGLRRAIDDLREISRGIHPAILAHGGLGAALKALARRSQVPVQLTSSLDGRLPERVEVAAYYIVSEALTNVARHSRASVVSVDVAERDEALELSIRDDGVGGAEPRGGTGLIGLKDRVEALGGRLTVESPPGHGTRLVVALPLGGDAPPATDESPVPPPSS
jgi:signal transduction histidine kinase/putative methionine-R-sulfoxide reductase with GAF domain